MGDRLIRLSEVESRVGLKKTAIYARIRDGSFPKPKKLAVNCSVWSEAAIDGWVRAQLGEATAA